MKTNKIVLKSFILFCMIILSFTSCNSDDNSTTDSETAEESDDLVLDVDAFLFLTNTSAVTVTTVPCTLSDGTSTNCYEIVATSAPKDHEMGPGVRVIFPTMLLPEVSG